jgi:hypothetical protein
MEEYVVLFAKIFPIALQFFFAFIGATRIMMQHILRRNPSKCPDLEYNWANSSRKNSLESMESWKNDALQEMPCIICFSTGITRMQSTIGLGTTIFTSIMLTKNDFFNMIALICLIFLSIVFVLMVNREKLPSVDKGLSYAFGCTVIGMLFVYASTIS